VFGTTKRSRADIGVFVGFDNRLTEDVFRSVCKRCF
jgi:hypothetical protein